MICDNDSSVDQKNQYDQGISITSRTLLFRKHLGYRVSFHAYSTEYYTQLLHCKSCSLRSHRFYVCASIKCHFSRCWEMAFWKCSLQNVAYKWCALLYGFNFELMRHCIGQVRYLLIPFKNLFSTKDSIFYYIKKLIDTTI